MIHVNGKSEGSNAPQNRRKGRTGNLRLETQLTAWHVGVDHGKNKGQNHPGYQKSKPHDHMNNQMQRRDVPQQDIHDHIAKNHHKQRHQRCRQNDYRIKTGDCPQHNIISLLLHIIDRV